MISHQLAKNKFKDTHLDLTVMKAMGYCSMARLAPPDLRFTYALTHYLPYLAKQKVLLEKGKGMLTDILLISALILSGALTGVAAGVFGIGGGTVLIPLLLSIFARANIPPHMVMHIAVSTSLALIVPTAITSSWKHYQNGNLDLSFSKRWIPGVCVGVFIGVAAIHAVSTWWLKLFFTVYLLFCIVYSFFKKHKDSESHDGPNVSQALTIATIVGAASTMLGIGGGTFTTPILTSYDYPLKRAIAQSAFTGLFIGLIGAVAIIMTSYAKASLPPYSFGYVNWLVFLLISPSAIIATPFGVNLGKRMPASQLNTAYTVFLSAVFVIMLYHLLT